MQRNRIVWLRAVTVSAAVMAILLSALAMSPEFDHRVLPTQSAIASVADVGVADDGLARPAADAKWHIGHACLLAIMPGNELALTRFDSTPELPRVTGYKLSGARYPPFHPPRFLSQA